MNLDRLRYFKLLAERGHLRETAELVNLSPGALSRAIKALETELGLRLFRIVGKRLAVTDRGRALLPRVDRLLGEYATFRDGLSEDTPIRAPVRFCSHSVFTTYFLGHLLREAPSDEEIFARNVTPGAIEASVASFESDFGLTYLPVSTPGIEFVPVTRVAMGVFVRRGAFAGVPFEDIPCSMPIVRVAAAVPNVRTIDAWPGELARGRVRVHSDLLETALECCRQGLSWGYFPLFVAWLHNREVRPDRELELLPQRAGGAAALQAFLVKRLGDDESSAMKSACRVLQTVCKRARAEMVERGVRKTRAKR
jgi:DNA-binding transcriptional LysR family regulator